MRRLENPERVTKAPSSPLSVVQALQQKFAHPDVAAEARNAITHFEVHHPGCKGLFLFGNSTGHNKMVEGALITSRLNIDTGGQVRLLD